MLLADKLASSIDSRIAGMPANSGTRSFFATRDDTTPVYVKNGDCWLTGIDLSGTSVLVHGSVWEFVHAIHPRIVLTAWHTGLTVGSARFLATDGTIVEITFSGGVQIGDSDFMIALTNVALPVNVTIYPVIDPAWLNYMHGRSMQNVPVFRLDQNRNVSVMNVLGAGDFNNGTFQITTPDATTYPTRNAFYLAIINLDSTDIIGFLDGSRPVLALSVYSVAGGYSLFKYFGALATAMNVMLAGATPTLVNLSAFQEFPDVTTPFYPVVSITNSAGFTSQSGGTMVAEMNAGGDPGTFTYAQQNDHQANAAQGNSAEMSGVMTSPPTPATMAQLFMRLFVPNDGDDGGEDTYYNLSVTINVNGSSVAELDFTSGNQGAFYTTTIVTYTGAINPTDVVTFDVNVDNESSNALSSETFTIAGIRIQYATGGGAVVGSGPGFWPINNGPLW